MKNTRTKKSLRKSVKKAKPHNHQNELKRLNRIKGQISGVEKMILENRYCPEIAIQIKAIRSALRSLEANIIESHLSHCVKDAIKSKKPKAVQKKMDEIILLLKGQG